MPWLDPDLFVFEEADLRHVRHREPTGHEIAGVPQWWSLKYRVGGALMVLLGRALPVKAK